MLLNWFRTHPCLILNYFLIPLLCKNTIKFKSRLFNTGSITQAQFSVVLFTLFMRQLQLFILIMALILDGNLKHVTQAWILPYLHYKFRHLNVTKTKTNSYIIKTALNNNSVFFTAYDLKKIKRGVWVKTMFHKKNYMMCLYKLYLCSEIMSSF